MRRGFLLGVVLLPGILVACFDPLYEEGLPLPGGDAFVPCCQDGRLTSCECNLSSCEFPLRACASSRCVAPQASCPGGSHDAGGYGGSGGTGGSGGSGGSSGDAGSTADAGTIPVDAGTTDVDAGLPILDYALCCPNGQIESCGCTSLPCTSAPFIACSKGRCVLGSAPASFCAPP